jgi:hypothetical protein
MLSKISARTSIKSVHREDTGSIDDPGASGRSEAGKERPSLSTGSTRSAHRPQGPGSERGQSTAPRQPARRDRRDRARPHRGRTPGRRPILDRDPAEQATGEIRPVTIVTDIQRRPVPLGPLHHVRIRARSPGQNGVRERGFGSLRSERRLYLEDIADVDELYSHAEGYLLEFNHVRPLCWNRPVDVHLGIADPTIPNFETARTLPTT